MASQCLPEGFGIDAENAELQAKHAVSPAARAALAHHHLCRQLPCSLLEIFAAGLTVCKGKAISHEDRLQSDPKYSKFIVTLTGAGFFKGVEEGTPGAPRLLAPH